MDILVGAYRFFELSRALVDVVVVAGRVGVCILFDGYRRAQQACMGLCGDDPCDKSPSGVVSHEAASVVLVVFPAALFELDFGVFGDVDHEVARASRHVF